MNQLERLEYLEKKIKEKNTLNQSMIIKAQMEKLRLIRKHSEFNNKLNEFVENEVFCTSRKDIIIYIEVGRIKEVK